MDNEQIILRALEALRYVDLAVAENYRKSVLVEMHRKELLEDGGSPLPALSTSDRYINMDVCPERYYTVAETVELLGVSRSLLLKLEDRGFSGEDIIKARSRRIPRRGKYKKR